MHNPKLFEETRLDILHNLIRAYPLATFVVLGQGELIANHIPLVLDESEGEFGVLRGHIARANPFWLEMVETVEAMAVFQGPATYITPSWYPSKAEQGKVVPTWNYAVVHAHGRPRFIDDPAWLLKQITALTESQEAHRALPWQVSDAPKDFVEGLMKAIIGLEMPISKIQGKWKVSQNRPEADKFGVVAGLEAQRDDRAQEMAALVKQHIGTRRS